MVMMSARHPRKPTARVHWIHSTRLHLVMYSMLLVATPFLMLSNFLQPNIARLSRFSFGIAGTDVPIILVVAALLLIAGLILFRAHLSPKRKVRSLDAGDRAALYHAMRDTLEEAIDLGGRDTERTLFGEPGGYIPVLDKRAKGLPCPNCGTLIEKIQYLGGSCYVCPTCQT